jgi:hypothetical protein
MSENNAKIKIVSGIISMAIAVAAFIVGRTVKQKAARITILVLSVVLFFGGLFVFVSGVDDLSVGVVGQYKLNSDYVQTIKYTGPAEFEFGLKKTFITSNIRRLHFKCADKSKEFTIYNTGIGIYGIPDQSVICGDGMALLQYEN